MKSLRISFILVFAISNFCYGQLRQAVFSTVSKKDLLMKAYLPDTTALAVILFESGETLVEPYVGTKYTVQRRIKFFKKEAAEEWANIKLFAENFKVSNLKGFSYNLVNDSIVKSEVSEEFKVAKKYNKFVDELGFTFPNIQDGTIIDYTYTVVDKESIRIRSWAFQHDIPVIWSEYSLLYNLPKDFQVDIRGTFKLSEYSNSKMAGKYHTWTMKNLPAFKPEPLMPHENLYRSILDIFTKGETWEGLVVRLKSNESYGEIIYGNTYLNKTAKDLTKDLENPRDKIKAISDYLKKNVRWNGIRDFTAYRPKDVLQKGSGSSGDINLLFASLLEKSGVDVGTALLSTRDHGGISGTFPSLSQFDYVICTVSLDDKYLPLDATEPNIPFDQLPPHCANLTGLLLARDRFHWVDFTTKTNYKKSAVVNVELTPDEELKGTVKVTKSEYEALEARKKFVELGEESYAREFWNERLVQIEKSEFLNMNNLVKPVEENFNITFQDCVTSSDNILYIDPFVVFRENINPFRSETRKYPIDFEIGKDELLSISITLPVNYKIQELPENKSIVLPGNAARFAVNYIVLGNRIQMTSLLQITKTLFNENEYQAIREFYTRIISKKSEPIVLRRTK